MAPPARRGRPSRIPVGKIKPIPEEPEPLPEPALQPEPQQESQPQPQPQLSEQFYDLTSLRSNDTSEMPSTEDVLELSVTGENRLDMDCVYFVSMAKNRFEKLALDQEKELSQLWLQKLCGEVAETIAAKRKRNIYLSHLVLDMDSTRLSPPFNRYPPVSLPSAEIKFGLQHSKIEPPTNLLDDDAHKPNDFNYLSVDGRTYLASRLLPHSGGAMAFLAITSGKEPIRGMDQRSHVYIEEASEPSWNNDEANVESGSSREYNEIIDNNDDLLIRISEDLEGIMRPNYRIHPQIQTMLERLERNLQDSAIHDYLQSVPPVEKTKYLLNSLLETMKQETNEHLRQMFEEGRHYTQQYQDTVDNIDHHHYDNVKQELLMRQEMLDELEAANESSTSTYLSEVQLDVNCVKLIESAPNKEAISQLLQHYPPEVTERFEILFRDWCHELLNHMQPRYDNAITKLRTDLDQQNDVTEEYKKSYDALRETKQVVSAVAAAIIEAYDNEDEDEPGSAGNEEDELRKVAVEFEELQARFDSEYNSYMQTADQLNTDQEHLREYCKQFTECLNRHKLDAEALELEVEILEEEIDLLKEGMATTGEEGES